MKLSIITPYWKTLDLTERLAKALEPQLSKEVEWIIVDDGCHEHKLDSFKAKVIHLDVNSGNASYPRNVGLDNAKGDYIAFIDSDDLVSEDYVEKILAKIPFDYLLLSWRWSKGDVVIRDEPPTWNTCVWNTVYSKKLIGKKRFNPNLNIAEDEDFNTIRKGKKKTLEDIVYYYTDSRQGSLTNRFSKGELARETLKCGLLVYQKFISKIGGIETFLYNFFLALNDYDILFVYREADERQLARYKKLVKCVQFNGQKFVCQKYLCASNQDNIADNVNSLSGEYYDMIHADLSAMRWRYKSHPKTTCHIAVSEIARKSVMAQDSRPCKVIYNLLELQEPKRPLMLMSAQRFSEEKGEKEMLSFARRLRQLSIPFIWICFTDNKTGEEEGIIFKEPVLDLHNYYSRFDYFVSFSRTESYGYSMVEAMSYGLPLVVRDIPVLDEIGFKDGEHGYLIKHDLSNTDDVIRKLCEIPHISYKKLDDANEWRELLGTLPKYNDYKKELKMRFVVEALDTYKQKKLIDAELGRRPEPGERWEVSKERMELLTGNNPQGLQFVRVIETKEEEDDRKEKVSRPAKKAVRKTK